jgi:hypothetical protein
LNEYFLRNNQDKKAWLFETAMPALVLVLSISLTGKHFSDINLHKYFIGFFMNKTYHIFGLNIKSDITLPAHSVSNQHVGLDPDVIIEYGDTPCELINPVVNYQVKWMSIQAIPGELLFKVDSVASYYVRQGRQITITPKPGAEEERILVFLMASVISALLHQRSILVLHAGAIAVHDRSVIFSGYSGVGKSTLAAGFHKRGYPFLTDDVCAIAMIDGKPAVIPGFSRLKLWADVLKKLDKDPDQFKSVRWTKGLDKYFLPVEFIHDQPILLKSVFVLETTNEDKMEITVLKGKEKINPIIKNTYRMWHLNGLGGKKDHFRQCAAVAVHTNVHKVVRPDKGFLLSELMDMLETKF